MHRSTMVAGSVLVALLAVTGCSGGGGQQVATLNGAAASSSSSAESASDAKKTFQDALVDFSRCMREHGVDMPDPTFDTGNGGVGVIAGPGAGGNMDPNSQTFKDANTACKPIMDAATKDLPKPSPEEQAKQRDQALAFAKCMRDHGIDMPDPTFDDSGAVSIQVGPGPGPNSDSANAATAVAGDTPIGKQPDPAFLEASKACQSESGGPMMFGTASDAGGAGGLTVNGGG